MPVTQSIHPTLPGRAVGSQPVYRPIQFPALNAPFVADPRLAGAMTLPGSEADEFSATLPYRPIFVEPLLDPADLEWRDWQSARQRAAAKARQAERDNLTQAVHRFLQNSSRKPRD